MAFYGGWQTTIVFVLICGLGVWQASKRKHHEVLLGLIVWLIIANVHVQGVVGWVMFIILLGLNNDTRQTKPKKLTWWIWLGWLIYTLTLLELIWDKLKIWI